MPLHRAVWLPARLVNVGGMTTTRHLRMLARSLSAVLALVLMSGLGSPALARPGTGRGAGMSAATVQQPAHREAAPLTRAASEEPAATVTVPKAPVADRTRARPAQRAAEVTRSRAPPAHLV